MKLGWVFQTVPMRTPLKHSFKMFQKFFGESSRYLYYFQEEGSFIHPGHFYSAPKSPLLLRGAPDYCNNTDTVSEFHAEAHRQLQEKDLPKVPTWRLERGVELTTLRLKVIVSTKAPPRPTRLIIHQMNKVEGEE